MEIETVLEGTGFPIRQIFESTYLLTTDLQSLKMAFADLDAPAVLSHEENQRLARLTTGKGREQFLYGRLFLRSVLASLTGTSMDVLNLKQSEYGKPCLSEPCDLRFNLSHSGHRYGLVISTEGDVGFDLEQHKAARNFAGLIETVGCADEKAWLDSLPQAERVMAFYQLWTLKEATLKADGRGFDIAVDSFGFEADVSGSSNPTLWNVELGTQSRWHWWAENQEGFSLAVAVRGF